MRVWLGGMACAPVKDFLKEDSAVVSMSSKAIGILISLSTLRARSLSCTHYEE